MSVEAIAKAKTPPRSVHDATELDRKASVEMVERVEDVDDEEGMKKKGLGALELLEHVSIEVSQADVSDAAPLLPLQDQDPSEKRPSLAADRTALTAERQDPQDHRPPYPAHPHVDVLPPDPGQICLRLRQHLRCVTLSILGC